MGKFSKLEKCISYIYKITTVVYFCSPSVILDKVKITKFSDTNNRSIFKQKKQQSIFKKYVLAAK